MDTPHLQLPLEDTTLVSTAFFAHRGTSTILLGRAKPGWYFQLFIALGDLTALQHADFHVKTQDGAPVSWEELSKRIHNRSWPAHDKRRVVPKGALECPQTRLWRAEVGQHGCTAHGPVGGTYDLHEYPG